MHYSFPAKQEELELGREQHLAKLKKGLFISFSANNTPFDFDNKVFVDAKEALQAYRKFKPFGVFFSKCWAEPVGYHHGWTWHCWDKDLKTE